MTGRPKGSRNKHSCRPFRDALRMELAGAGDDSKALRKIAHTLLNKAALGDVRAIKELADRMDGRPGDTVEMSGEVTIAWEDILARLK